jgi:hypothetical protein
VHAVAITMDFKMFFLGLIKGLRFTWNSQFIYESMFNNNFNICRSEKESRVDRVISNVFNTRNTTTACAQNFFFRGFFSCSCDKFDGKKSRRGFSACFFSIFVAQIA